MRDPTDIQTIDLAGHDAPVFRGQVLADRQQRHAVVVKVGWRYIHVVCVQSGALRLSRLTPAQAVENWVESDCPLAKAVSALLGMGRKRGVADPVRSALEALQEHGRDPIQRELFPARWGVKQRQEN